MVIIKRKDRLAENITRIVLDAPLVAAKAKAGQFVIIRPNEKSERIPLTVADYDREKGELTLIYQTVGRTTAELDTLSVGDSILNLAGPLGKASQLEGLKKWRSSAADLDVPLPIPKPRLFSSLVPR